MFASRRAIAVAPRRLLSSKPSLPLRTFATEATSPAPDTPEPSTKTKPAAAAAPSKWAAKPKPTRPAPVSNSSSTTAASSPPSEVVFQAKTIAHQPEQQQRENITGPTEFPAVNWATSFHGISAKPVTEAQFKVLMQPLEDKDIEVKPDGVIYLPEIKYRRRLNEAFGPMGWGMIPRGEPVVGSSIVTREYALIVDGRFVSQSQGENSYFGPDQLPSAVEGCKSNAIMRCCKDLGIASELWDPHFVRWFKKTQMEEVWVEHATTKKKRTFWYRKGAVDVAYPYRLSK